jgi:hypothetical protein
MDCNYGKHSSAQCELRADQSRGMKRSRGTLLCGFKREGGCEESFFLQHSRSINRGTWVQSRHSSRGTEKNYCSGRDLDRASLRSATTSANLHSLVDDFWRLSVPFYMNHSSARDRSAVWTGMPHR